MATESDLPTDWWTTEDVASFLSLSPSTVRAYLARKSVERRKFEEAEAKYAGGMGTDKKSVKRQEGWLDRE